MLEAASSCWNSPGVQQVGSLRQWLLAALAYAFFGQHLSGWCNILAIHSSADIGSHLQRKRYLWHPADGDHPIHLSFCSVRCFCKPDRRGRLPHRSSQTHWPARHEGDRPKVAVIASALFGTISGSAIANVTVTVGFTIRMMKRLGYKPEFAGPLKRPHRLEANLPHR